MGKKKMETVGEGLGAIREALAKMPTVVIPKIDLLRIPREEREKMAEEIRTKAREIRDWVGTILVQLEEVQTDTREAQELIAKEVAEAKQGLEEFLGHETLAFRRAARLGYLCYRFSGPVTNHDDLWALIQDLVEGGYLEENSEGPLQVGYKYFRVTEACCFGEEETEVIVSAFNKLRQEMERQVRQERKQKSAKLRKEATTDYRPLLGGLDGNYVLEVPPERYVIKGKEMWRGGGTLRVFCQNDCIYPEGASGSIDEAVAEAMGMEIHVLASSLHRSKPPFIKGLDSDKARKVQLLWHLLKRGITAAMEQAAMEGIQEELSKEATISDKEFFLEEKFGTCLAVFQGVWKAGNGTPTVRNLFFLVERKEVNKDGRTVRQIQVVKTPDHLEDFLAGCQGQYEEKGEKFEGLPQPLKAVLQAIYGQIQKAASLEE